MKTKQNNALSTLDQQGSNMRLQSVPVDVVVFFDGRGRINPNALEAVFDGGWMVDGIHSEGESKICKWVDKKLYGQGLDQLHCMPIYWAKQSL